jgi:hypothetical protein
VLDNTVDGFTALNPDWARDWISLSQILGHLAAGGTTVRIATRPAIHNRDFIETLKTFSNAGIVVSTAQELHAKGILGDTFFLSGSMYFSMNGITVYEEMAHFLTDPMAVSEAKLQLQSRWGGAR